MVDLERAKHNVIVLLFDGNMSSPTARKAWSDYVDRLHQKMAERGRVDFYIPFTTTENSSRLECDTRRGILCSALDRASFRSPDSLVTRLLLQVVLTIRQSLAQQAGTTESERLFVSHAKLDGDVAAAAIVAYIKDPKNKVALNAFYDAKELSPGDSFIEEFTREIKKGTLLAIVSDVYDSRPWCIFELTVAKRAKRPIVLADVGKVRISRTYPYGANLPRVRVNADSADEEWIEPLLVQCLSEGLRCDLFTLEVTERVGKKDRQKMLLLPRPPELFDIIECDFKPTKIVYPDPPLGLPENEIIARAMSKAKFKSQLQTLSELT
ncbi:TIR domain-containing protein [Rhizobium sp. Rhizsp82]|uniref:TIR domain-containing protein n=1 Tax=Rhizobium sp. Rhizsp82 TaxID=3243057 RepID=UPI0039B5A97D